MKLTALCLLAISLLVDADDALDDSLMGKLMKRKLEAHMNGPSSATARLTSNSIKASVGLGAECDGSTGLAAGMFPCKDMDVMAFLTGEDLGSPYASNPDPLIYATWVNDIWGWNDPSDGSEYALVGMWDGVSIVDISIPGQPEVLVFVEQTGGAVEGLDAFRGIWRDIKVVNNVMYIGSEVFGHGIQTYDLTKLKGLPRRNNLGPVPLVSADFITEELGSTHNVVAVPAANKVLGVGMSAGDPTCPEVDGLRAALAIFDVSSGPVIPQFEKCLYVPDGVGRGYVHDADCILYDGPETVYVGMNICALFMEEQIAIVNLDSSIVINTFTYATSAYVHQGGFSEDHTHIYADDEVDELDLTTGTDFSTTYIFDVTNLDGPIAPPETFVTPSAHPSIDHNLYIRDGYIYQAAYTSGARIRKINEDKSLTEVAFFDTELICECVAEDGCDCDFFAGTWTFFPLFDSGITIAGSVADGLFILKPNLPTESPTPSPTPSPVTPSPVSSSPSESPSMSPVEADCGLFRKSIFCLLAPDGIFKSIIDWWSDLFGGRLF